jgi:DTW domain-containing protein YfiP
MRVLSIVPHARAVRPCCAATSPAAGAAVPPAQRHVCRRCDRALCLCEHLPQDGGVETATRFVIVQSRQERFNALSTGRLCALGLSKCSLVWDTDADEVLLRPADVPADAGLLFPGPSATTLCVGGAQPPNPLVVIDATWHEATRWLRKNPWLAELPRYALAPAPEERSTYRIRRQPKVDCLSTVECVARVLQAVEPGPACDAAVARLIGAFDALVELQLDRLHSGSRSLRVRNNRVRTTPGRALRSRGLGRATGVDVVVYAEYYLNCLVSFVAVRLATHEMFQCFVALPDEAQAQLAAVVAANTQQQELWISWSAATASPEERLSPQQFHDRLAKWLQPSELVVMWNARHAMLEHPLGKSADALPPAERRLGGWKPVGLKEAYAAVLVARNDGKPTRGPRSLAECVASEPGAQAAADAQLAVLGAVETRACLALTAGMALALDELARTSD